MTPEKLKDTIEAHVTYENRVAMLRAIMGALMEKLDRTTVQFYCEEAGDKQRKETPLFPRWADEAVEDTLERALDDLGMLKDGDGANFSAEWLLRKRPALPKNASVKRQLDKALGDLALLEKQYGKGRLLEYLETCGMR